MKSKIALLMFTFVCSSVFAQGRYVAACSGQDSKGNQITLKLVDLGTDHGDIIELKTGDNDYRYNVLIEDIDTADIFTDVKSKDHGGITMNVDGDGATASGRIGILKSTYSLDCTPGPAAP